MFVWWAWRFGPAGGRPLVRFWEARERAGVEGRGRGGRKETYIELPSLNVLARVLVRDDDDEARDLTADHPLVELRHDALDVGLDLVVGGDCSGA